MDLNSNSANEKFDLDFKLWKLSSAGALVFSTEVNQNYTAADVADTGGAELSEYDNSSNLYMGLHAIVTYETDDGSADGSVDIYWEYPTDGGTIYPSDKTDFDREADLIFITRVVISGAQVRAVNFEL